MRLRSDRELTASPAEEECSKEQRADEVGMTEDDGDGDWEDERRYDIKLILETAEQVNRLLLSPRFVNRKILDYANKNMIINGKRPEIAEGPPTREQDEWLEDPENWPDEDQQFIERANDLISRNMMSAMMIADKEKGGMMIGGQFDFGEEVEKVVTEMFGGKEKREHFEKTKAGLKE